MLLLGSIIDIFRPSFSFASCNWAANSFEDADGYSEC
jgi:hypothetical protein